MRKYHTKFFREQLVRMGFDPSEEQIGRFLRYYEFLAEWNQKINLTAITEYDDVILKHFLDSASFGTAVSPKAGESLIDVGTGAGFPGIPLKILYPELEITLLDSLNKRVRFLDLVIRELGLEKIKAFHGRAEDFGRDSDFRGQYDYAVSRAVANLSTLSEYCVPFVKTGGLFVAYKSGEGKAEERKYLSGIRKLNAVPEKSISFELQGEDGHEKIGRTLLLIRKEKETPSDFPRKAGIPAKKPLS